MQNIDWINRWEYPFKSNFLSLDAGQMHYIDEGAGTPIVMVHGTPTWSFLYRHLIKHLSKKHRVIAADNIGFGLSDKPQGWSYRPADHAANLKYLIKHLELKNIVLVVHDFGGPIGLSYAVDEPENIAGVVLFNTWMWSLEDQPEIVRVSNLLGGTVGRFLYEWFNFSPRVLLKMLMTDKSKLTNEIHQHYLKVFPNRRDRYSTWVFARELIGSSDWYEQLWGRRENIKNIPALLLWGLQDKAFQADALEKWTGLFEDKKVVEFAEVGHFVQEEDPFRSGLAIEDFVQLLK